MEVHYNDTILQESSKKSSTGHPKTCQLKSSSDFLLSRGSTLHLIHSPSATIEALFLLTMILLPWKSQFCMPTIALNWYHLSTSSRTIRVLLQQNAPLIFIIPSSTSFISSAVLIRISERSSLCRQTTPLDSFDFSLTFDRKLLPSNL